MLDMTNIPDVRQWFTIGAAAHMLGVSRRTVQRMIQRGTLTAHYPSTGYEAAPTLLWYEDVNRLLTRRIQAEEAAAAAR